LGVFLEMTLVTKVVGQFGAGDSCSHSHWTSSHSITWILPMLSRHIGILTLKPTVISYSFRVAFIDDTCGVGCDDLFGRLHVVTMWFISTVWIPVDDSTTLQRFAICCEGVLHFTLAMHSSYFSFTVRWTWEVLESVLFLWSAVFISFWSYDHEVLANWPIYWLQLVTVLSEYTVFFALLSLCSVCRQ